MAKYKFQNGGQAFDYTDTDFFNNVVDNTQQQDYSQNYQPDNSTQEQQPEEEESDYVKNLRSYDAEQPNEDFKNQLSDLEQRLNGRFDQLSQQQQQQNWLTSDDGIDYLNDKYDSRTDSTPLDDRQMQAESGGDDNAISPKGAMGAYQFMPSTWDEYKPRPDASPFNRADATYAHNKYMNTLMNQFGNDQRKAMAAYNAGPGRISSVIKQYGDDWEQHIPAETKGYLNKIFSINHKPSANLQNVNVDLLNIVGGLNHGLVVTSGNDSKHMQNSAHYDGDAVDIGANSSNKAAYNQFKQQLPDLQRKYGIKYLDEGDHIHLSLSKSKT